MSGDSRPGKLSDEAKTYIARRWAEHVEYPVIAIEVQAQFGIEITRQGVTNVMQASPESGFNKWRVLGEKFRTEFEKGFEKEAGASKRLRLQHLEELRSKNVDTDPRISIAAIEASRREIEGTPADRKKLEEGLLLHVDWSSLTKDEQWEKVNEMLKKMAEEGSA